MKSMFKLFALILMTSLATPSAQAVDVNFNLLNVNTPDQNRLQQTYANAYGFTPAQVAPVMMAPATEIPSILQIAQNAATMPLAIWGMRKVGLSFMDILKMYTLPPSTLFAPSAPYDRFPSLTPAWGYQQQYGNNWPSTIALADPVIIQLGQIKLFTDYLRIPSISLLSLPTDALSFSRVVLNPWGNPTYFIPPGQAKKMGLWIPPGQAKKMGLWSPPGHSKKQGGKLIVYDGDDDDHGHGKGGGKGGGKGKGKW